MHKIGFFGKTDVGLKRSHNEDVFVIDSVSGYCLAADGMGGAAAGEEASRIFGESACQVFSGHMMPSEEAAVRAVQEVFSRAHQGILEYVDKHPENLGMGCTAELLVFSPDGFVLGHIGDSRTYRFRSGQMKQLSQDHSLVQDQLDHGLISHAEARTHHLRNVILRAVGVGEELALDLLKGQILPGDLFLLCSDGLTDLVDDVDIVRIISGSSPLAQKTDRLIESAKAAGGDDNITVVLAEIGSDYSH